LKIAIIVGMKAKSGTVPSELHSVAPDQTAHAAQDIVKALDWIFAQLSAAAPREGSDWEVPLTFQEVRVIKMINARGAITMSSLAIFMGISLPTATHLVDRLVAKEVVVRTRSEDDRRKVLVALSERSIACVKTFFENRVAMILRILEPFPEAEREQFANALGKIARAMQSEGNTAE